MIVHDPVTTEAEQIQRMVEAKYCKADLLEVTKNCTTISEQEQEQLLAY